MIRKFNDIINLILFIIQKKKENNTKPPGVSVGVITTKKKENNTKPPGVSVGVITTIYLIHNTKPPGVSVGVITSVYTADSVLFVFGLTAVITFGLAAFAMQTKYDFTGKYDFTTALI
jgi:FtsH-binding integral membrane protein